MVVVVVVGLGLLVGREVDGVAGVGGRGCEVVAILSRLPLLILLARIRGSSYSN